MSDYMTGGLELLAASAAITFALKHYFTKQKPPHHDGVQLSPGPPLVPIIGNASAIDVSTSRVAHKPSGSQYGDTMYTQLSRQESIVISPEKNTKDLLEHRSQNYSDRPAIVTNELLNVHYNAASMQYGSAYNDASMQYGSASMQYNNAYNDASMQFNERGRLQRKYLQQSFRQDAITSYRPMLMGKTHDLLMNLLEAPLDYEKHFRTLAGSVIMSAVYSYEAARRDDHMIQGASMAVDLIAKELRPEVSAVFSIFPFLLRIPSWLPGMCLKRTTLLAKELHVRLSDAPFDYTERGLAAGLISSGMVTDHMLKLDESDSDFARKKKAVKESAATAFAAGVDPTATMLMNFVLAMVLYPEVQEKAHALIEKVAGRNQLPTFEDRPSLLYVDAIMRECLRWRPVAPLVGDNGGYVDYGGAAITTNVRETCHAEQKYPNPSEFNPERFLDADGSLTGDTVSVVWGFGRRVCPGRYLAESSLWSAMACLLAVFTFSKAKDGNGREIDFEPQWHSGIVTQPKPFLCAITPRDVEMDMKTLQHMIKVSV